MSDRYFVDTNILIYAHDRSAGVKHTRARALVQHLWRFQTGVLSTQVLQEFCANIHKKVVPSVPLHEVRAILEDYLSWETVVNSPQSILRALDLKARYPMSFWEALILQAAEEANASVLYSEDLASGQHYGSVRVVNPLSDSFALEDRP